MKKNKIIQFSLVIVGIILFFFTYYSGDKDKIADIDKSILIFFITKYLFKNQNCKKLFLIYKINLIYIYFYCI